MSGYVITNMKIKNHEKYKDYIKSVIPSVKKYKGQYLFRGGRVKKFLEGKSPPDFAAEDYEVNYEERATIDDLTELGKKQMAL